MRITSLCYIERDACYLMLYRNKKPQDPNAGKWIGIGGHLEEGETIEQCAVRETLEETGLTLLEPVKRGVVFFQSDVCEDEEMHLFTCAHFEGALHECSEGELKWIPKDELLSLNLWEGDAHFLQLIARDNTPYFHLTLRYEGDRLVGHEVNYPKEGT